MRMSRGTKKLEWKASTEDVILIYKNLLEFIRILSLYKIVLSIKYCSEVF